MVHRRLRPPHDGVATLFRKTVYILPFEDSVHARVTPFHSRLAHLRGLSDIRDIHTRQSGIWRCRWSHFCWWDGDRSARCTNEENCAVYKFAELYVWGCGSVGTTFGGSVHREQEVDLEILLLVEFA